MIMALYIINVWEMLQAAWEFRSCNALILPPLHFNEFFIENFSSLQRIFFSISIKDWSLLLWHNTDIQTVFMPPFLVSNCVWSAIICTTTQLRQHQSLWLIVAVIWPWTAVVVMCIQASRWLCPSCVSEGKPTMIYTTTYETHNTRLDQ